MKVLVVSDTHGHEENFQKVLAKEGMPDHVIHLGDSEDSGIRMREMISCPLYIVAGNCDFFSNLPREEELELCGHRILLTHGHYYRVSMTKAILLEEAQSRKCDIAMYGHTHRPDVTREGGVTLVNPGSLAYPRQENRRPSYILMEIDAGQQTHYTINYV